VENWGIFWRKFPAPGPGQLPMEVPNTMKVRGRGFPCLGWFLSVLMEQMEAGESVASHLVGDIKG
jgi:hypothetical protein